VTVPEGVLSRRKFENRRVRHDLDDEEICRRYLAGESTVELALAMSAAPLTISRRLRICGVPMRPRKTPGLRHRMETDLMVAAYEAGLSIRTIGERHGLCGQAVRQRLIKRGVRMRPRGYHAPKA
jgi:hypothetical protein